MAGCVTRLSSPTLNPFQNRRQPRLHSITHRHNDHTLPTGPVPRLRAVRHCTSLAAPEPTPHRHQAVEDRGCGEVYSMPITHHDFARRLGSGISTIDSIVRVRLRPKRGAYG